MSKLYGIPPFVHSKERELQLLRDKVASAKHSVKCSSVAYHRGKSDAGRDTLYLAVYKYQHWLNALIKLEGQK